jgi:hypothetical protein
MGFKTVPSIVKLDDLERNALMQKAQLLSLKGENLIALMAIALFIINHKLGDSVDVQSLKDVEIHGVMVRLGGNCVSLVRIPHDDLGIWKIARYCTIAGKRRIFAPDPGAMTTFWGYSHCCHGCDLDRALLGHFAADNACKRSV